MAALIGLGISYSAEQGSPMTKTALIGMNLRTIIIFVDQEGTHFQYFTQSGSGQTSKILGEEIFKNGEKVFDSYREND